MNPATGAPSWSDLAREKRESILAAIPEDWRLPSAPELPKNVTSVPPSLLSSVENEITTTPLNVLLQKLQTGEWSSVDVTKAFLHRAAIAHQLVNCLMDFLLPAALERAEYLDRYLAERNRPIGPLHGLPISLKDTFRLQGVASTLGYVGRLKNVETEESESYVVKLLRQAGAVFYVKTSVPTSILHAETINNIIGYTWNPHNTLLSSSGSSGGEGALIALDASIVGLGTDIAGSLRMPASAGGFCTLRPSHGRLPSGRVANSLDGQETINSVIGPMGRTLADMSFITRRLLAAEPWTLDPNVVELPWRESVVEEIGQRAREKGLVFGLLINDGVVKPHPPVVRGVKLAADRLRSHGHKVIDWCPPAHSTPLEMVYRAMRADGGEEIYSDILASGEDTPQHTLSMYGPPGSLKPLSIHDYWKLNAERYQYQQEYLKYWMDTGVDAVIMPVFPSTSCERDKTYHVGYTAVVNLLDYSSAVFPVTKADKQKDVKDTEYVPVSQIDKLVHDSYEPELFHGMPVCIQVVGRRLQEEKVLALAKVVEDAIKDAQQ